MGSPVQVWLASAGARPRATAHKLLLKLAGTLVDRPALTHDETGRPRIAGLAVSLSYTQQWVVVAASSDGPLGVDLEELRPRDFQPLVDRWYTPQERDWLRAQPDQLIAFLRLWTAKEAVGKALGLGLHHAGLRREMPLDAGPVESAPGLRLSYLPHEHAVLAVAAPRSAIIEPRVTDS
ncbi:4'-phosphopantetheinyl transferase superfamily protein [Kribbella solani]|uniref:Phosphopantetheinyl transferase n=1 Tax=Kribbella solani TaxID=236067 RepID=A0A841DV91_9ACTN|nr:phosphopantetheinyl transferase [Kribbella solani]